MAGRVRVRQRKILSFPARVRAPRSSDSEKARCTYCGIVGVI